MGASHDAPGRTASLIGSGGTKLPPIEWSRTDYRKLMLADLRGAGSGLVGAVLALVLLMAAGMSIAIVVTTILNAMGFDPSSLY